MESFDYDVFLAVSRCEEFEPEWEQLSCSKGVFMENVGQLGGGPAGGDFSKDDLFFPCNKLEAKFALGCYNFHASYILFKNNYDVEKSFKHCDKIIPEEFIKY